jgi:hypothetical protein
MNTFWPKDVGGTPSNKNRFNATPPDLRKACLKISEQRIEIGLLRRLSANLVRIKVAVGALTNAPRQMDIKA